MKRFNIFILLSILVVSCKQKNASTNETAQNLKDTLSIFDRTILPGESKSPAFGDDLKINEANALLYNYFKTKSVMPQDQQVGRTPITRMENV